jgi:cell division protein ZapA
MATNPEPVSVSILDREYQFHCEPGERKALIEAAHFLSEKMREVKASGRLMALERIAVMTALNLADELLKMKATDEERKQRVDDRIRRLADEVEDALGRPMG